MVTTLSRDPQLLALISDILLGGEHVVSGVQKRSPSVQALISGVSQWGFALHRSLEEITAMIEPCLRQSILMSLIPAVVFEAGFTGSIPDAIRVHLDTLGLHLSESEVNVLRDVCINAARLRGLSGPEARRQVASLASLRAQPVLFEAVMRRQNRRCIWCGVGLELPSVAQSLEHVTPKHLGGDPVDGSNWAISCLSCNSGKRDTFAWAAQAEAHDYVRRNGFEKLQKVSLEHRWAILMRSPTCQFCNVGAKQSELWAFRRVPTGLPIPSHCDTVCTQCAADRGIPVLKPDWDQKELARFVPS